MGPMKKAWALIKMLKAGTYDKAVDAALPVVLENKAVKPFLAEHKTVIGYWLMVAYYAAEQGVIVFPQIAWLPQAVLILGVILGGIGIADRGRKERRLALQG